MHGWEGYMAGGGCSPTPEWAKPLFFGKKAKFFEQKRAAKNKMYLLNKKRNSFRIVR